MTVKKETVDMGRKQKMKDKGTRETSGVVKVGKGTLASSVHTEMHMHPGKQAGGAKAACAITEMCCKGRI